MAVSITGHDLLLLLHIYVHTCTKYLGIRQALRTSQKPGSSDCVCTGGHSSVRHKSFVQGLGEHHHVFFAWVLGLWFQINGL